MSGRVSMANERRFIQVGMSEAEVIKRHRQTRRRRQESARPGTTLVPSRPRTAIPKRSLTVTLVNGQVANVERKVVQ
jgi:hypothetical protein